uniref:Uncharacterized protein n=1 Tax=Cacopsylla melanoneura TaxID=428564 RepID=A0A8D8YK96_9HEMI
MNKLHKKNITCTNINVNKQSVYNYTCIISSTNYLNIYNLLLPSPTTEGNGNFVISNHFRNEHYFLSYFNLFQKELSQNAFQTFLIIFGVVFVGLSVRSRSLSDPLSYIFSL